MKIATDKVNNWVYVTGPPRSGSTFIGQILSFPLDVDYFHEPFNPGCGLPIMNRPYVYVRPGEASDQAQKYRDATARILTYDFKLRNTSHVKDSPVRRTLKRLVGSRGPFYLRLAKVNPFHRAAVVKDPTAPFLAEFLAEEYGLKPVVVLRHPVALASSLKRVGWGTDLRDFANQPHLVEDYLQDEVEMLQAPNLSYFEEIAVHWRCIYKVLLEQAAQRAWPVVKIEEVSQEPLTHFRTLFDELGLTWSSRVERQIVKMTGGKRVDVKEGGVMRLKRDSKTIFAQHRDAVAESDRRAMYALLSDIIEPIYVRESFALGS